MKPFKKEFLLLRRIIQTQTEYNALFATEPKSIMAGGYRRGKLMSDRSILIRDRSHQCQLVAVLLRYGIGSVDKYGRGVWISYTDLDSIASRMETDIYRINIFGEIFVPGNNPYSHVSLRYFSELFD